MPDTTPTLRDRIATALTTAWYQRAAEKAPAAPEEHCAALADAVLAVLTTARDANLDRPHRDAFALAGKVTQLRDRIRVLERGANDSRVLAEALERTEGEVERLSVDRAAVLREATDTVEALPVPDTSPGWALGAAWALAQIRRLADEAQQPETEAWPTETEWIGEVLEDDAWMYLGASPDRSVAEKRRASVTRRHPNAQTRTVRKTTTYTVAAEQLDTETEATRLLWSDLLGAAPDITGGACTQCYMDRARDREHDMSPDHAHCRAVLDGPDTETEAAKPEQPAPAPAPTDDRCPGFCIPCMTDESHDPAP